MSGLIGLRLRRFSRSYFLLMDTCAPIDCLYRTAELHGAKYIKQFARVMWKQCGMRLVVFEMHKDMKTELCIASYAFITSLLMQNIFHH